MMTVVAPPNAEDVGRVIKKRLAAVADAGGTTETTNVEWRGAQRSIPVITMPVSLLSYNPATHRVRVQRTLDPVRDKALDDAPYSPDSQAYLHQLLMGVPSDPAKVDPAFTLLKEDLQEHGQTDPGIVTHEGVLINGNTRRAALQELGEEHIRVGVLPADAGHGDLESIELSLQLRRSHKRDYSFMNFLLALEERVSAGRPTAEILSDFRIKQKTFDQSRWILQSVYELINRSKTAVDGGGNVSLRLVDFETDQGKLEELYRAYSSLKAQSPDDAEVLREQRLLAVALDKSKTDLRLIDAQFADKYAPSVVAATEGSAPAPVKIPGTSVTVAGPSKKVSSLRTVVDQVLQAKAVERSPGVASAESLTKAKATLNKMNEVLETGLAQAGKDGRVTKKRFAPVDRLADANEDLALAVSAIADAQATSTFEADDLDEVLQDLRKRVTDLAKRVSRGTATTSDGVAWLCAAAVIKVNGS
jgi:ParB-like chromosome segregation protein Spo0J